MESLFPDVERQVSTTTCMECRIIFSKGDSIIQVWLVAGVGRHPIHGHKVPFLNEIPGFCHARCEDPTLSITSSMPTIERYQLRPSMNSEIRPRTPEYQCHACKNEFRRGDVLIVTAKVLGMAIDPSNNQPAIECSDNYEAIHKNCQDPKLNLGGPVIIHS